MMKINLKKISILLLTFSIIGLISLGAVSAQNILTDNITHPDNISTVDNVTAVKDINYDANLVDRKFKKYNGMIYRCNPIFINGTNLTINEFNDSPTNTSDDFNDMGERLFQNISKYLPTSN